jgi:hypothetical protein
LPSEAAAHSDVAGISCLDHIVQSVHLEVGGGRKLSTHSQNTTSPTVSSIGVSGSNLRNRIRSRKVWQRKKHKLPMTLKDIHIVDLEAFQAGLDRVEDVLTSGKVRAD